MRRLHAVALALLMGVLGAGCGVTRTLAPGSSEAARAHAAVNARSGETAQLTLEGPVELAVTGLRMAPDTTRFVHLGTARAVSTARVVQVAFRDGHRGGLQGVAISGGSALALGALVILSTYEGPVPFICDGRAQCAFTGGLTYAALAMPLGYVLGRTQGQRDTYVFRQ